MTHLRRRALLRSGVVTATTALAGCAGVLSGSDSDTNWPVVSANGGRTANAGSVPATAPSVQWQSNLDATVGRAIYARNGTAVAVTPAGLRGVSISDGSPVWSHAFNVTGGAAAIALAGEVAIGRRWFPGSNRSPRRIGIALADGTVRYADQDDYAGAPLWVPSDDGLLGLDTPGRLRRFDAATGEWGRHIVDTGGEIWGTVTDGNRLYLPIDRDGEWTVEAIGLGDTADGWSRRLAWEAPVMMVATGNRLVFTDVPDVQGRPGALGLDPATGAERWRFTWEDPSLVPWRAAATPNTLVLLARPARNEGAYRLAAVDLDSGNVRWRTETALQLPYAIDGDRIVGTQVTDRLPAPGLVAHTLDDGREVWRAEPAEGVGPGIAVSSGILAVLATADGPALARLA